MQSTPTRFFTGARSIAKDCWVDGDQARQRDSSRSRERGRGGTAYSDRVFARMIGPSAGTRIWIAAGVTDLRRGFTGLSGMVQTALQENPFSGHVFVFRGRRGDLIKVLWFDGDGLCLFAKRLERGRFIWPQVTSGTVALTPAQFLKGSTGDVRYAATIRRWWRKRKDFCYFPTRFSQGVIGCGSFQQPARLQFFLRARWRTLRSREDSADCSSRRH
jgi:transposase